MLILNPCEICDPNLDLSKLENPYAAETASSLQYNLLNKVQVAYVDHRQQKRKREIQTKLAPRSDELGHEKVIHSRLPKQRKSLFARSKKAAARADTSPVDSTDGGALMASNPDHLSELPWDSDRSTEELVEEEVEEAINGNSHKSSGRNI